jgi:hypothetical protein
MHTFSVRNNISLLKLSAGVKEFRCNFHAGEGTKGTRLFTPGERKALAKSKVVSRFMMFGGPPHCMISKIWLLARSGIGKILIFKDIHLENRFIYTTSFKAIFV